MSVSLLGTHCDPGEHPEQPTIAITEIGPTFISGTSSPCVDDGLPNPPGRCTQVLLVTPATPATETPIASGTWTVSGLSPSTQYTVQGVSSDGVNGSASAPIAVTTASTQGPKIVGVAPTEIVAPNDSVWISGNFAGAGAISVKLVDSTTGQVRSVPVEGVDPNRIRVSVPRPSDLNGRRRYFLQVNGNNKAHILADVVYLSSSGIYLPPAQSIQVQLIRWQWVFWCNPLEPCSCLMQNSFADLEFQPLLDPWPDTWASAQWSRFRSHFDDTTREWSAMCSEARGAQSRVAGLAESNPRVTLPNSSFYQLEIATDSWDMALLANRQRNTNPPSDYCTTVVTFIVSSWAPPDCANWLPNQNGRINVHLVGKFRFFGEEVDPAMGARGIADPPNIFTTNTRGMVVLTDNPFFQARPMPKPLTWFCPSQQFPDFGNPSAPLNNTFWWGGPIPMQRSTEPTPNLLSHELHHVTTGYVHGGADPCHTPAVGDPDALCPRGFDMDLGVNSTVASECQKVINGVGGRDYTQ